MKIRDTSVGPWFVDEPHPGGEWTILGVDRAPIAAQYGSSPLSYARLAAAAPDLVAVAREACAIFDGNREVDGSYNNDLASDLWKHDIHDKLVAAIAKAEVGI